MPSVRSAVRRMEEIAGPRARLPAPFPLGFALKSRAVAYIVYSALHVFLFTFQSLNLLFEWVDGSESAFGPYPEADSGQVWGYGAVNLAICLAGLGLVALGHWTRGWRARRRSALDVGPA